MMTKTWIGSIIPTDHVWAEGKIIVGQPIVKGSLLSIGQRQFLVVMRIRMMCHGDGGAKIS